MRSLSAPERTALASGAVGLAVLVDLGFTPPVRLCSGSVTLQVGADLYFGTGVLGAMEAVSDEVQGTQQLRFSISGVPSESLALALGEQVRGTACTVRLAILDAETHALLGTQLIFAGELDQMPISHGAETSTVGVIAVHRGETYRRPKPLRYTDNDQQLISPGDTSCRYVLSQSQVQDVWPSAAFLRV